MKTLRAGIDAWVEKADLCWRKLPLKKQRRYTLYFFLGYLLLTIGVIVRVWYNTGKPDHVLDIRHIENPILKKNTSARSSQHSSSIILKNKQHERK